jgi:predicted DNA-binding transcriptional regulator AlpA
MNKEYIFTLKYKLPTNETDIDELVDRLYTENCDDALIGLGVPGRIALEFSREAESAESAIISAHEDILKTIPGAQFIEALPDYVGITDIADIVSVSRQQVRKIYQSNLESFPSPVHEGKSVIWHLSEVLKWISVNKKYNIDSALYEVSRITTQLNCEKGFKTYYSDYKTIVSKAISCSLLIAEYSTSIDSFFSDKENYSQLVEAV